MFAVFALLSLLICVGLLLTAKDLLPLATKMYKYPLTGVRVIYALFWAILSIWVLVEVFT
jgi:hypothetical protein